MVRAGEEGILFQNFHEGSFVSIGWEEVGDLKDVSKEEIRRRLVRIHPDYSAGKIGQTVGILFRFCSKIEVNDRVVTYNPSTREYLRGKIISEYQFTNESDDKAHRRKVEWHSDLIQRDALGAVAKNALGSAMSVFSVSTVVADEIFGVSGAPDSQIFSDLSDVDEAVAIRTHVWRGAS